MKKHIKTLKPTAFRVLILAIFTLFLVGIIGYARGYRLDFRKKLLTSTGILAVNSYPQAAKVYLKDSSGTSRLQGATSINLNLSPGTYTVEIKKEGYTSFSKTVTLKGEIVQSVDALLFPINPSLSPLSNLGIVKAVQVDQTDSILLFTDTGDPAKDGIYIYESGQKVLSFLPPLTPLLLKSALPNPDRLDFTKSNVTFSYDYKQAVIDFTLTDGQTASYLISMSTSNQQPFDVTGSTDTLFAAWEEERVKETNKILEALPEDMRKVASDSFHIVSVSPDETKILYKAKSPNNLPLVLNPPLIGANQNPENRNLVTDKMYVYDKKEDKNFRIENPNDQVPISKQVPTLNVPLWYPDSKHFVISGDKEISVIDYDGTNRQPVYSGPYEQEFVGVNSDGKLLVLINLNPQANKFPDLYSVGIK